MVIDQKLLESFAAGDCVAYVGAGFSAPIDFPTWRPLLERLIEDLKKLSLDADARLLLHYAKRCLSDNHLSRAASTIGRIAPPGFLDKQCRLYFSSRSFSDRSANDPLRADMQNRLDSLTLLPWAGVITTNYDLLIDEAAQWRNVVAPPFENLGPALKSSTRPFLIHLYGSIAGQSYLTEEEYDDEYVSASPLRDFLSALLLRYTLVFIGTQVDDRFVELKRELQLLFRNRHLSGGEQFSLPAEYVLFPDIEEYRERGAYLRRTGGFRTIFYESNDNRHEGLVPALQAMRDQLTAHEFGSNAIDQINHALREIVTSHPSGITQAQVTVLFAEQAQDNSDFQEINEREIYYRLMFLVLRKQISFNHEDNTFKTPRHR